MLGEPIRWIGRLVPHKVQAVAGGCATVCYPLVTDIGNQQQFSEDERRGEAGDKLGFPYSQVDKEEIEEVALGPSSKVVDNTSTPSPSSSSDRELFKVDP